MTDDIRRTITAAVAQLRHVYSQLVAHDERWSRRGMQSFADGLLAPQIRKLEAVLAAPRRPEGDGPRENPVLVQWARDNHEWAMKRKEGTLGHSDPFEQCAYPCCVTARPVVAEGDGPQERLPTIEEVSGCCDFGAVAPSAADRLEDVTCEHGTAMDVHCCNCHSGFIFDLHHECPPVEAPSGTYRCPICGRDTPHHHERAETIADAARLNGCALREYGRHTPECEQRKAWRDDDVTGKDSCICGFSAALADALRRDHERMAAVASAAGEAREDDLRELVEELCGWWHLNREGSVNGNNIVD